MKCSGWVHHLSFSPSGCRMAYVAHDSTIAVIDTNRSLDEAVVLRTVYLPFTSVQWVTEKSLIAAVSFVALDTFSDFYRLKLSNFFVFSSWRILILQAELIKVGSKNLDFIFAPFRDMIIRQCCSCTQRISSNLWPNLMFHQNTNQRISIVQCKNSETSIEMRLQMPLMFGWGHYIKML